MQLYKRIINFLYNKLTKEVEEIPRSDLLRDYYNQKYPTVPIFYNGRYLYSTNTRFKVDVRNFFTLNDENLHNITKSLRTANMTDNQKALACLKWVIQNVSYITDQKQYGVSEYWDFPFETLKTMKNDCESQSILLANLMLISGIPNWKIRIVAGYVFEPISKRQVGHAYTVMFDEETEKWKILDCTFYPNIKLIKDREEYKKEKMYQDIWFSFNNEFSWTKDSGDIRNMEGFKCT